MLFRKFRARNWLQNLLKNTKRNYITNKLTENIAKSKELWKTLSQLGLPSKQKSLSKVCLQKTDNVTFEAKGNCEIFKEFFANLSTNLVNGLPNPANMFGIDSVNTYYSNLNLISKSFHLTPTSFEIVLKLLQEINPAKSAGIDKIGGRFLKDGAPVLANPIKNLCNLSIKLSKLLENCEIALLKPLFKKELNSKQKITERYPSSPLFLNFLKKLSRTKHKHTWRETTYFTNYNLALDKITPSTLPSRT